MSEILTADDQTCNFPGLFGRLFKHMRFYGLLREAGFRKREKYAVPLTGMLFFLLCSVFVRFNRTANGNFSDKRRAGEKGVSKSAFYRFVSSPFKTGQSSCFWPPQRSPARSRSSPIRPGSSVS